ncbi:phage late control D family protein [Sorangium sp. So ce388]|uniref:phage late control D family protein n=1 Tax=Sorangium sp. So ce388 TaxID=3133309 RepID=UPI003F5B399E
MPEPSLSRQEVYRATPTIRVDGQADAKVAGLVRSMRLVESEGGMSALELRLDNLASDTGGDAALAFEDERIVKLGATIAVYGGDESSPQEIFRGVITALEATFSEASSPELVVLAEDALQRARMARRTLVHADASIADLANDLASRLGLRPVITGFSDRVGRQAQIGETDLAFVRRLVASRDGDLQVVGDELHVSPRKDVRRGAVELALYSQLRRARVTADLAHQATGVIVGGWDAVQGQRVEEIGTGANLGPGAGRRGDELLLQAIGQRDEHLHDVGATTDAEARAVADAAFDRRARRFVCVDATAIGNPALRVGTHVTLSGLSRRFDNTYYVVRAVHRFDRSAGYETDFEAECAFLGDA